MCMSTFACMCVYAPGHAVPVREGTEEGLGSPAPGVTNSLSPATWVMGSEPQSSARATSSLSC